MPSRISTSNLVAEHDTFVKYIVACMDRKMFPDLVAYLMTKYLDKRGTVDTLHTFHKASFLSFTFAVVGEFISWFNDIIRST